ncbi:MAG: hypothetical protein AAFS11_08030 [Planctomycetota bacterium]
MTRCAAVVAAATAALTLAACSSVQSFYSLGNEGRLAESPFQDGPWYIADDDDAEAMSITPLDPGYRIRAAADDADESSFIVDIIEHDGVRMFDAIQSGMPDEAMTTYYIGRVEQYGDCLALELIAQPALDHLAHAGVPMLIREGGVVPAPTEDRPDFDPLDASTWSEFDEVLITATPERLRATLASLDVASGAYVPFMLCPGDHPTTAAGHFDAEAFAVEHPEAHQRIMSVAD